MTNVVQFPGKRNRQVEIDIPWKYEYTQRILRMSDKDLVDHITKMDVNNRSHFYDLVKSQILEMSDHITMMQFDLSKLRKVHEINNAAAKIFYQGDTA